MSKGNTFENDVLKLFFNGTAIANIADNAASAPSTALWASLHTADVGESGTQGTNEASYAGYARVGIARSTAGFVVSSNSVDFAATVAFGAATSTSTGTLSHFAVGLTSASTGGKVLYKGTITPNINFGQGVTARLTTGSSITED
jgi:hypothetical protein